MKNKFQSKSVPRGTRTIWRYLGALFILFTLGIGQMWATALADLNFSAPSAFPSGYTNATTNPVTATSNIGPTGDKRACLLLTNGGGGQTPTISSTGVSSEGKRWMAFSPAVDCSVDIVVFNNKNYFIFDVDNYVAKESANSSNFTKYLDKYTPADNKAWYTWTVEGLKAGKWYVLSGGSSQCYIASMTFTAASVTPVCPSGLSISGTKNYTEGQKIELTAALTAGNGAITYQWYKGGTAEGNKLTGKTAAKLEIASCAGSDAGDYYCKASKADCSGAVNAEAYTVTVATIEPTGTATITYALSGSTTTGTVTGVNSISSLSSSLTLSTLTLSSTKDGYSGGIKGCTGTDLVETDYVDVQFTVGSGYVFTPSAVTVQANPLGNTGALKAVVKVMDAQPLEVASNELACAKNTDNAVTFASGAFTNKKFEGTVHLRMYFYGAASDKTFYLKSPISITGTVAVAPTKYNVNFDKNDEGAGGSQATLKYESGAEVTLPACTFTAPTGMEFDAWTSTDVTITDGKFTMPSSAVTIKATWKTSSTKYTVTYKEGETTLDTEDVVAGTAPTGYLALESKNLASFVAWYSDPDLAEGHKIADMSALTISEATTFYGKWTYDYASSVNIEQWILTNGAGKGATTKTSALIAQLGTNNFASNLVWENGNIELDSLDDAKGDRNEPYLGLKVKSGGKMLDFRVANGQTVKVKFGAIKSTLPQVSLNGGDYANMSLTEKVWSYTATGNDYISIKTADANAVVFKQIMINEDLQTVTLPWRVTYDAGTGTCATAEAIWSGSALTLPAVTAPTDYTFAGWYDEATGGVLVGAAGASYTPTDNETLFAHFAPVEYAIAYDGNGATSGSMVAGAAGWGTLVTPAANAFEKTGHIFSGWEITKTEDGSATGITFSEGKFEMPKYDVTLVAQWEDNSKVAVIVETNVKYESLADAITAAEAGQTIQLLQNIEQANGVAIAKNLTLDLNGKTFTCTSGSNVNYRAIKITAGTVTIQNGSIIAVPTANFEDGCYGPIRIEGATANVTLEDLTLQNGRHYGLGIKLVEGYLRMEDCTLISENGGGGLEVGEATADVINCTFTQTGLDSSHAWISTCLATCDNGVLNVQGGTYTSDHYSMYVYTSGGEMNVESGSFTGDVVNKVTPSSYPDAVGTINITGGTFEGVGEEPIHFTTDNTGKTSIAISGGSFDAPVENEYCAPGYVPSAEVAPGVYTVVPKDGVEIIGVVVTGNTTGDVSGLYKGTATVNLNSKKIDSGKYIYVTLKEGYTFEENDVLIVDVNTKSNIGTKALEITTGVGNIDGAVWKTIAFEDYATGDNIISLEGIAANQTSIGLKRSDNQNSYINGLRVLRPMKPILTAITIDERAGVIDPLDDKHFNVQIPYEADLAALTVVPTIVWNEAAATNSIVVNDGSAWIEGANTYKLTDKDGDYTVYTITLTRDVQKHTVSFNTHGGTAVASEEVVHGEYLAAAPAAPTKEENVFKHWAETEDGEAVDVTTVQINADKTFHAVWEAEPAGIKLFNGNVLNTTNFISAAATTIEISEVEYPCLVAFASNRTSLAGAKQGDLVMYSATTDAAKIKFDLYNANSSAKTAYVWVVEEGDAEATQLDAIEVAGTTRVKTAYYEFNGTKNRTVYLTSGSKADIKVLQAKVIESGSAIKQFGDAGYTLKLNQGRIAAASTVQFEGATVNVSSEYAVLNNSNLSTKSYIKFTTTVDKMILHVEKSGGKFYVSQDPEDKGTIYNANTDVELTPAGEWYLGSETSGSAASFTNIAFIAPKCAEPAFNALANSDICEGASYEALDGTATVAAGVPTYQWYREDNSAIEGETNATYTPTADGKYYVIAVNHLAGYTDNEKKSALVTVTTHAGTAISEELANQRGNVDDVVTLEVVASGKNLHYAWKESATIDGSYTDVAGAADAASLDVTITEGMSKYYKVVVSGDCGDAQESIAKVEQFIPVAQADVTGSIAWNWANAASVAEIKLTNQTSPKKNEGFVMANGAATVYNNANFESDKLYLEGEYIVRDGKYFQGQTIKFNTTVAGVVRVKFSHTGSNKPARELYINGVGTGDSRTNATAAWSRYVDVPAGEVTITAYHVDPADGAGQQYIRVPEIEFLTIAHRRTAGYNVGDLGTVCLEDATIIDGATLYELQGLNEYGYLAFDEIQSGELEAGKPYLFEVTNPSQISFYKPVGAAHADDEIATNGMIGTFGGTTLYQNVAQNYYYFSGRHIWRVNDFTVSITLPANRCYVDMDELQAAPAPQPAAPGRRRVTLGVNGKNTATGIDAINASDKPMKLIIDGNIYIIRGEKMYDVTGKLVK